MGRYIMSRVVGSSCVAFWKFLWIALDQFYRRHYNACNYFILSWNPQLQFKQDWTSTSGSTQHKENNAMQNCYWLQCSVVSCALIARRPMRRVMLMMGSAMSTVLVDCRIVQSSLHTIDHRSRSDSLPTPRCDVIGHVWSSLQVNQSPTLRSNTDWITWVTKLSVILTVTWNTKSSRSVLGTWHHTSHNRRWRQTMAGTCLSSRHVTCY